MKSKMSCCNTAILKRTIFRGLPLWGVYLLLWIILMPLPILSNGEYQTAAELERYVVGMAANNCTWMAFLYALGAACRVCGFLYKSRSANFYAALPVKRQTLFATQYLAGLAFGVVPGIVIMGLTMAAGAFWGANLVAEAAVWFASQFLGFAFFYGFAMLIGMIVGNLIALPLIYGVLNFAVVLLEAIVRAVLDVFVYGAWLTDDLVLTWASPLVHMMGYGKIGVHYGADTCSFYGWQILAIYAAVGILFAAIAYFVYLRRPMETAGDVIAMPKLKPVFLYAFTIGCTLCLGYLLATVVFGNVSANSFITVLLCMLVGAFIGYFSAQMMLHRTIRVFRRRFFANYGVFALVILALMVCVRFDLFGYSGYVPEFDEVEAVSLGYDDTRFSNDPQLIEGALRLHRELTDVREEGYYEDIRIAYRLKNGKIVRRCFEVDYNSALYERYNEMYYDPDYVVVRRLGQSYTAKDINYCNIYDEQGNGIYLTSFEAYNFMKTCLEPDLRDSAMRTESADCGIFIEICFAEGYEDSVYRYNHFAVTADAHRILNFIEQYGGMKDGASFGIIGGANGPTEIYVTD